MLVALGRFSSARAGCPPVELDTAVRTLHGSGQRAQVAGRRRAGRVGRLFRLRSGVQHLFFERVQLLHEMEVGIDVGLALQHHVVRLVQRQLPVGHQVRQHHGHRTRYARQTVYQDAFFLRSTVVCEQREIIRNHQKTKQCSLNNAASEVKWLFFLVFQNDGRV